MGVQWSDVEEGVSRCGVEVPLEGVGGGAGDRSGENISIPPSHGVVIVDIIY